jgi:hypothetical protein|nr:MAG TPA: protein of unknown function (DUF4355) [Bacteriophage sp.]
MNKKLFLKVKDLCKDTGVSEKCLKAITEKMGGSIEDDSTDEEAIETTANLIAEVAKETQSEATRWANKKPNKSKEEEEEEEGGNKKPNSKTKPEKEEEDETAKEIAELKKKVADMEAERSKGERSAAIAKAMATHNIPAKFRDRLAKSISDEDDIEETVKSMKQDFITDGLMTDDSEGSKGASEKQVDEAANGLLESITVK